ncbi:toxin-antitoxin system YwqK family antitoxin [Aquimarina algiphila]|uniref:Toxin-antitoxin system YwqK family antitoxin n=1 Tax=Aquimarina algiphila TaxID=2047982 RepID=A0A554VC12_9FLAO|nr:hypothetical protein [Aquimarina algiphila]TSE04178.1 hypothetical protein FOF46_27110 [Aquimarina algiphila]
MSTILKTRYLFLIFLLYACNSEVNDLNINDRNLTLDNGYMYYKDKLYSGTLFSKIDTLTVNEITYLEGKKHGKEQKFFFNGKLAVLRFYTHGKKSGTHKAWWNNGQLKFVNHFDINGNPIGTQRAWYSNGKLAEELNYTNGKEDGTQKLWDFNGKIKANYQVLNGERFGLIGSLNCKSDNYVD